jgi:signal transduction histidine kinase
LPRIFDRFYRVESSRPRDRGGAGLGLAIVQALVTAHQGTLQVRSQIGQGTTFSIRFPTT